MGWIKSCWSLFTLFGTMGFICSGGDFTLQEKNGSFSVGFRGKELISSSSFTCNDKVLLTADKLHMEKKVLPDGSTAFNVWSKDPQHRFRQEGVINANGSRVEINMQFEYQAYSFGAGKNFVFALKVPFEQLKNVPFEAVHGRNMRPIYQKGVIGGSVFGNITAAHARMFTPQLERGSVLFDFSPHGVCTYAGATLNTNIGMWGVMRMKDDPEYLQLVAARTLPAWGGGIAAKLVLTAGGYKEFKIYHPRQKYSYYNALPAQKLYSFGADKVGYRYCKLDLKKSDSGDGWSDSGNAAIEKGKHEGAFYSAVYGSGNAGLTVGGLQPGYYFVTLGAGNFEGKENKFSVKVNGKTLLEDIVVKNRTASSVTKVFKLEKGVAEIEFSGNWRISTLGFQQLLNFYEDFSFSRGFWVTDGFEPGVMYNNAHYAKEPDFAVGRTDVIMPDPEQAPLPDKPLVYTVALPDAETQKLMEWRYNVNVSELGINNNGTFHEFNAPGLVERRMDELKRDKCNMVLISGLLSRHTYPAHLARVRKVLARMADAAHQRGMKIYDHIDYTLLWNMDSGFRVAAEKPYWLARELDTLLPTTDFCVNNHDRNQAFRKYLGKWVRDTNIDGIMIDEACFTGSNFCGCGDCRSDFTADTDQQWPLNELAPDQVNKKGAQANTPLAKQHRTWRKKRVGDWWVELRKSISEEKADFSFQFYTTHYGLSSNYAPNQLGSDMLQVGRAVDFLGTEIMPRNIWATARAGFAFRKAMNMFKIAFGTPIYGQIYAVGGWDVAYFGWGMMNMNGQVYWAEPAMECPPGKSNYFLFGDRNMDIKKALSHADVALLFSSQGRDNAIRMNYRNELFGLAQTLGEMNVNYDIIADMTLSEKLLQNYKVLFVAASGPLSDEQISVIRSFAEKGGTVVLGPIAGIADQYGNLREKWPFEDIFKFKPADSVSKVRQLDLDNGQVVKPQEVITAFLPVPRDMEMPEAALTMVWGKTRIPAAFDAALGKGRVIFMPLAIGSAVMQNEVMTGLKVNFELDENVAMAYRHLLKDILKKAQAGTWQCNAPAKVFTTLYKQENCYYAHFLNATGVNLGKNDVVRNALPENAFPPLEEDIEFVIPDKNISRAQAASPDFEGWKELVVSKNDAGLQVKLPKELLKVYTLVRVD